MSWRVALIVATSALLVVLVVVKVVVQRVVRDPAHARVWQTTADAIIAATGVVYLFSVVSWHGY